MTWVEKVMGGWGWSVQSLGMRQCHEDPWVWKIHLKSLQQHKDKECDGGVELALCTNYDMDEFDCQVGWQGRVLTLGKEEVRGRYCWYGIGLQVWRKVFGDETQYLANSSWGSLTSQELLLNLDSFCNDLLDHVRMGVSLEMAEQ